MTTNGLPESADSKESNLQQNEDKNHRFVCYLKTENVFKIGWHLSFQHSLSIVCCCFERQQGFSVVYGFWTFSAIAHDEDSSREA